MRVVLASASPRRKSLLEEAGYHVICIPSDAEEAEDGFPTPLELALENARRKFSVVAEAHPGERVIAADTVVSLSGELFGKPGTPEEAIRMLRKLSGRTHEVITGVVIQSPAGRTQFGVSTQVTFHPLDDAALRSYVSDVHTTDKAGGYAAQDDGGRLIARVEGSFTNVVGLPMERVNAELRGSAP